jgi:hypothetical protein
MMRSIAIAGVIVFWGTCVIAQTGERIEGTVSYKSSQNIYVKFNTTTGIESGDTLFVLSGETLVPALEVKHTSSTSVMGTLIGDADLQVSDVLIHQKASPSPTSPAPADDLPVPLEVPSVPVPEEMSGTQAEPERQESIRGRLSVSMYHHMYDGAGPDVQRLRYVFSMRGKHLNGSRVSTETYISYRHQFEDWSPVDQDRTKALRVYSLALRYDFDGGTRVSLGRAVNTHITNIGAIDGLQAEHRFGKFAAGGFAGFRPDYSDYGLNTDLLQYGGFLGYRSQSKHGTSQSSLAIVEQRNSGAIDRRFTYLQHSGMLSRKFSVFASAEFDLYSRVDSIPENKIHFTSTYVSLQYRPSRKLTLHGSYDARKNIIYYETYQNFIDELLEQEMRQGLRFRATWRMMKYVSVGSSIGYRFQKDHGSNSMNMHYYLRHSRVPGLKASAMASVIFLDNDYLKGTIYGIRLSRDIIKQKLYGELEYRMVDYRYGLSETTLHQDIAGVNLTWRIRKRLSLALDYEGVFADRSNNRFHLNVVQRF